MKQTPYQKKYEQEHREQYALYAKHWRERHPEKYREVSLKYRSSEKGKLKYKEIGRRFRSKWRSKAFEAYGGKNPSCACCGESHPEFLTIDHINGKGNEHRKTFSGRIESWLAKNNYPPGFQILCFNCNWAKATYGICPHKSKG
jgi:hypothetical protein